MTTRFPWGRVAFCSMLFLTVLFVSFCAYFYDVQHTIPRELSIASPLSDQEFYAQLGIETKCRRFMRPEPAGIPIDDVQAYRANLLVTREHRPEDLHPQKVKLNINQSDVVVLLHIQKTGGSFIEGTLGRNLDIYPRLICPHTNSSRLNCQCPNDKGQLWLVSKPCVRWPCGLHADYTELNACIDKWFSQQPNENRKRNYRYITIIRDPIQRFFSEWIHVRGGATWIAANLRCGGRKATAVEVPICHKGLKWQHVSFDEFMNCSSNLAFNRQTRMLANLSLSDCYRLESNFSRQERDEIMLQSAKDNLARSFSFFGLLEYLPESQLLLEKTLVGLKFNITLEVKEESHSTYFSVFSETVWNRAIDKNLLDVRLYQYAKDLFLQRLKQEKIPVKIKDPTMVNVPEGFAYTYVDL